MANDTLQNYQQSYAFVEKQLLTGSTTVLALEQARGMIESTRADIAKRQGQLAQANNALQLLLGSYQHLPDDSASSIDLQGVTLPPSLSSAILLAAAGYSGSGNTACGGQRQHRRRAGGLLPGDHPDQLALRQQQRALQPV